MSNSQLRCVFVGNIPYDATEEQLVQICEEVGPVVSFRVVIDRETGKPKGYGFCEYKDEETALSARRNLHGYDINGRQLRVDFAENDKNNDRSREQGRSGPGLPTTTAPQKPIGGPTVQGDLSLHQPVGLQVAMAAAVVMAGTQNGVQSQPILGTDPLTLHLAKIPKAQLVDLLTEVKGMATQNKEQARQLLLAHPQLSKAVLQAHIMLKTVPPYLLQMPNAQQVSGPHALPIVLGGPLAQPSSIQPLSGVPPLAQNKVQLGFIPQSHNQPSSDQPAALVPSPYATPLLPPQARLQTTPPSQRQVLQQSTLSGHQLLHPQPNASLLNRVENHTANPSALLQYSGQNAAAGPVQPSMPNHKPSSSFVSAIPNNGNKDHINPQHLLQSPDRGRKVNHHPNIALTSNDNVSFVNDKDQISRPSKLLKMDGGRGTSYSPAVVNLSASKLLTGNQILKTGPVDSQKQNQEPHAGIDSVLLQQVLNLSPEQLSSLHPEQQQQVIQLQQMLRKST